MKELPKAALHPFWNYAEDENEGTKGKETGKERGRKEILSVLQWTRCFTCSF